MGAAGKYADVPESFQGVWSRSLLSTKDSTDITTKVFWLQTASLFGDLRIPTPTPAEGVTSLGQASKQDLLDLAEQDGFAGVTEATTEGDKQVLTWHREVNFRPESAANVDAGYMIFSDPDHVREEGLDGSYWEEWERLPESKGPTWGFRLAPAGGPNDPPEDGRLGLLLGAGDYFIFVADRRNAWTVDASTAGLTDEDRRCILDCEISFGRISGGGGSSEWEIQHSTLPGRVGKPLLAPSVTFRNLWKGVYSAGGKLCAGRYPPPFGWQLLDGFHGFDPATLQPSPQQV